MTRKEATSASARLRNPSTRVDSCFAQRSSFRFDSRSLRRRSSASRNASSRRLEKASGFLRDVASFKSFAALSRACSRKETSASRDLTAKANCARSSPMRRSSSLSVATALCCWASSESHGGAPGSAAARRLLQSASSALSCVTRSRSFPWTRARSAVNVAANASARAATKAPSALSCFRLASYRASWSEVGTCTCSPAKRARNSPFSRRNAAMSSCSGVSAAQCLTAVLAMARARDAYRKVFTVSSASTVRGDTQATTHVEAVPPSESFSRRVSFEFRKGAWRRGPFLSSFAAKAATTLPKASKPLLISMPSRNRAPCACVRAARSEPARSTKTSLPTAPPSRRTRTCSSACDRELRSFICVAPVRLLKAPLCNKRPASATAATVASVNPGTTTLPEASSRTIRGSSSAANKS